MVWRALLLFVLLRGSYGIVWTAWRYSAMRGGSWHDGGGGNVSARYTFLMLIKVRVKAGARKEVCERKAADQFVIAVKEPAAMNAANARVRAVIALHFKVPASRVRIMHGHHAPSKILSVALAS